MKEKKVRPAVHGEVLDAMSEPENKNPFICQHCGGDLGPLPPTEREALNARIQYLEDRAEVAETALLRLAIQKAMQREKGILSRELDCLSAGVTLRDLFAAFALVGQLANPKWPNCGEGGLPQREEDCASHWAYGFADAMLVERERMEAGDGD